MASASDAFRARCVDNKQKGEFRMKFPFLVIEVRRILLTAASVAAHELVDATSGVDELALTRVEGVRTAGDLELH